MTTLTLTKHHGLGNDFLVAFHPVSTISPHWPGGCAIGAAASAPTGYSSPRPPTATRPA